MTSPFRLRNTNKRVKVLGCVMVPRWMGSPRCFDKQCCRLQWSSSSEHWPWRWRHNVSPKRLYSLIQQHRVTSLKIWTLSSNTTLRFPEKLQKTKTGPYTQLVITVHRNLEGELSVRNWPSGHEGVWVLEISLYEFSILARNWGALFASRLTWQPPLSPGRTPHYTMARTVDGAHRRSRDFGEVETFFF